MVFPSHTKNFKLIRLFKIIYILALSLIVSCGDDQDDVTQINTFNLIIKFKFDPSQERLRNLELSVASGNAAQSPTIHKMSANYIEFTPTATTALGTSEIIFEGDETTAKGAQTVNMNQK
jgi:hypothetical protein